MKIRNSLTVFLGGGVDLNCKIRLIYQEEASLTKARNNALSYAKTNILICSDDDIQVQRNTLSNVVQEMHDSSIAMIAGIDTGYKVQRSWIGYLLGTKSFLKRKQGYVSKSVLGRYPNHMPKEGQLCNTEWAMGYFFVIRKDLIDKWGLRWDEKLRGYAYSEDLDFSYAYYKKAKQEQYSCILTDKVKVLHKATKEYRIPRREFTFQYVINRAYICYKHRMGIPSIICMHWVNWIRLIEKIVKNEKPKDMWDAMCYLRKNKGKVILGDFGGVY